MTNYLTQRIKQQQIRALFCLLLQMISQCSFCVAWTLFRLWSYIFCQCRVLYVELTECCQNLRNSMHKWCIFLCTHVVQYFLHTFVFAHLGKLICSVCTLLNFFCNCGNIFCTLLFKRTNICPMHHSPTTILHFFAELFPLLGRIVHVPCQVFRTLCHFGVCTCSCNK